MESIFGFKNALIESKCRLFGLHVEPNFPLKCHYIDSKTKCVNQNLQIFQKLLVPNLSQIFSKIIKEGSPFVRE